MSLRGRFAVLPNEAISSRWGDCHAVSGSIRGAKAPHSTIDGLATTLTPLFLFQPSFLSFLCAFHFLFILLGLGFQRWDRGRTPIIIQCYIHKVSCICMCLLTCDGVFCHHLPFGFKGGAAGVRDL